ncbi:MAG: serine hydrolase domain-containing protein, partial [Gemmatimonadota bacterium]
MKRLSALVAALAFLLSAPAASVAQQGQEESYDYWRYNRDVVWRGVQAILTCNGLFTSHRTLDQVYEQELAYGPPPVPRENVEIDRDRKAVAIGEPGGTPVMRAAFREGIGCVILSPDQTFADIPDLPRIDMPPPPGDPDTIPWPNGDMVEDEPLPAGVDSAALQQAAEWAFDRESKYQVTVSLLVVKDGQIVLERYAPGFDVDTRTRTWSTAKSLFVTVLGTLAEDGRVSLDEPLGFQWLPKLDSEAPDPRDEITLRNVLHMSSGLYPVDDQGLEYATGSGLAYWAGANSSKGARDRGLVREPGTFWDYENYDTLLGVLK